GGESPLGYNPIREAEQPTTAVAGGESPLGYNISCREPAPARRQSAILSAFPGGSTASRGAIRTREKSLQEGELRGGLLRFFALARDVHLHLPELVVRHVE